ncbi:MAG: aromatic ring-hydroxylating dioxygenase subunit alpha [Acidimicrobiales bacterium]|nr:aromatic ring-hydroxylating dioxygenase subunit alpha [Acidimicrobiales bacterium]
MAIDTTDWQSEQAWVNTRAPITAAMGLPSCAYTDQRFYELEQEAVFARSWVTVGLAAEVAEPGPMLVRQVGAVSVLITRGEDGELRGFRNSCHHRGTELAESDCTIAGTIRCPYHRWGYSSSGDLIAAPFFEEVPRDDFDPGDYGLLTVRVATWGVLLFACLDERTPPLDVWLGDLPRRMSGYGLDGWRIAHQITVEVDANWKLISENFQEYYHLTWVHPDLAKVSRVKDHYRYQGPGMYCGQTTTPVSGDVRDDWLVLPPATGLDDSDATSGRFVAIYPNTMLSVLPNHVFHMRLEPLAPGRTRETCTLLLPPSTPQLGPDDLSATLGFWIDVNNEDIDICQRSQRGLARGGAPAGPLAPRFEEPLHRFHNMLADCMTARSPADLVVPGGDDSTEAARLGTGPNPNPPAIERNP